MHQHSDGGKGDKWFKLKIRHVILGILAALLVAAVLHMALLSTRANRRIEALRAAGQPTSLSEYALRNKLPMGMENAAGTYEKAFTAFVPPPEDVNVPYVGKKSMSLERGATLSEPTAKAIADCLAANEKCLALLHEAAGIGNCRYEYDYYKGYPHLDKFRRCALLLKLAIIDRGRQGDAGAVVTTVNDSLRLSDSLRGEPMLISHLIRIACTAVAITGLEHALSATSFTDSQLKDLDDTLAATSKRIDLTQTFIAERCSMIDNLRDPSLSEDMRGMVVLLKFPGVRSRGLIDVLDHMEACVEAAGLPPAQRLKRFREIEDRLNGLSSIRHVMVKMMSPAVRRVEQLDSRCLAHLDMAKTALAIERYRLATGNIPAQLTDLVPKYLEQVPLDPFDGQPIRYRRTEPGYVLWSIMDDGQDNGGKEREQVPKGESYDLCFIVVR